MARAEAADSSAIREDSQGLGEAFDLLPEKLYVELTSRCNLRCRMCVKYAPGSCIGDEDLPFALFRRLESALAGAHTLVLNGIGEPLLHPELTEAIRFARAAMPPGASIGFQSNGVLLTPAKGEELIAAGLSTLCLSLDSLAADTTSTEHSATAVARALAGLTAAKRRQGAGHFRPGLEIVLSAGNIAALPRSVQWAADHGAEYLLATHLLLYDREAAANNLFNPNPAEAIELVERYRRRAAAAGGELANALATHLKFHKNKAEQAAAQLFAELLAEARAADIRLHLPSLLAQPPEVAERVAQAFAEAESVAARNGIELKLPRRHARSARVCPFIAERALCIAANGAVTPCHFLWHSYSCRVHGEEVQVRQLPFGWLQRQPLAEIWQSRPCRQFRREAGEEGYASCWSCSQGPCATLVNDNIFAAHDCYGSQVPCGHCQWNLGGVQCL